MTSAPTSPTCSARPGFIALRKAKKRMSVPTATIEPPAMRTIVSAR